jgi:hypothetical protein
MNHPFVERRKKRKKAERKTMLSQSMVPAKDT